MVNGEKVLPPPSEGGARRAGRGQGDLLNGCQRGCGAQLGVGAGGRHSERPQACGGLVVYTDCASTIAAFLDAIQNVLSVVI